MRHKSEELMKQIMDYAEQFQLLNHRSPYTSEIADALGIVKSTVYKYLVAMNDRGMLSYRNGEIVTERTNKISLLTKVIFPEPVNFLESQVPTYVEPSAYSIDALSIVPDL